MTRRRAAPSSRPADALTDPGHLLWAGALRATLAGPPPDRRTE